MCGTAADENRPRYQLVRAHANAKGPAKELLRIIVDSTEHTLVLSPFLLHELERVFSYQRIRALSKLTDDEIADYLSYLPATNVSEVVFPGPAPRVVPSDADDDPVVHTAVVGRADVLCTLNRHFFDPVVVSYCQERGVAIATDLTVLGWLRK